MYTLLVPALPHVNEIKQLSNIKYPENKTNHCNRDYILIFLKIYEYSG